MKERPNIILGKDDVPVRIFNSLARAGFARKKEGDWFIRLGTMRSVLGKIRAGKLRVAGVGPQTLQEYEDFLKTAEEDK